MTINKHTIETWALIAAVIAPTMRRKNPSVTFEEIRDEAKRQEQRQLLREQMEICENSPLTPTEP